jgi:hypothetical protein
MWQPPPPAGGSSANGIGLTGGRGATFTTLRIGFTPWIGLP